MESEMPKKANVSPGPNPHHSKTQPQKIQSPNQRNFPKFPRSTAFCFWLHVKGLRTIEAVSPVRHVKSMPHVGKFKLEVVGVLNAFAVSTVTRLAT
jgi:hypothetical protein